MKRYNYEDCIANLNSPKDLRSLCNSEIPSHCPVRKIAGLTVCPFQKRCAEVTLQDWRKELKNFEK